MCGLFGFSSYGKADFDTSELTKALAVASTERGLDATGISYVEHGRLAVKKAGKSAYRFKYDMPKNVKALMGHTRHTTQGSEKVNANNHPFKSKLNFTLAHNGVLSNDVTLRKKLKLPHTSIKTDSYIAVQLLDSKGKLNMDSLKYMAETVEGSFAFSLLDNHNNLWLVKGDSPISILHFKDIQLYVYASTDKILWEALINSPLFGELKKGQYEQIVLKGGDLLKICSNGKLEHGSFDYNEYSSWGYSWLNYRRNDKNDYLNEIIEVANSMGYDAESITELYENGFNLDEIEEYIYGREYAYECGVEI